MYSGTRHPLLLEWEAQRHHEESLRQVQRERLLREVASARSRQDWWVKRAACPFLGMISRVWQVARGWSGGAGHSASDIPFARPPGKTAFVNGVERQTPA